MQGFIPHAAALDFLTVAANDQFFAYADFEEDMAWDDLGAYGLLSMAAKLDKTGNKCGSIAVFTPYDDTCPRHTQKAVERFMNVFRHTKARNGLLIVSAGAGAGQGAYFIPAQAGRRYTSPFTQPNWQNIGKTPRNGHTPRPC